MQADQMNLLDQMAPNYYPPSGQATYEKPAVGQAINE